MPIRSALAAASLIAALSLNAGAAGTRGAPPPPGRQNSHDQLSLERAVQQVQQQTDGRILAADSIPNGRNKLYRIKVLTPDGHVRVMQLRSNDGMPDKEQHKHDRSDSGGRR